MNKFLTIILTIFAFSLSACATFSDPLLQKTYDECVASSVKVAEMKDYLKKLNIPIFARTVNASNDKKVVCKTLVEDLDKMAKESKLNEKQRKASFDFVIAQFKAGKFELGLD